ncbi:MAG: hypothetical protein IT437_04090 [Phycisphaerales bacterium]|nr:hypothetical protein [Phycisphaerales bacterium]
MALTIREQIEPHLRAAGIKPTAEAAAAALGMAPASLRAGLHAWLAGGQAINDRQLEAVAAALGLMIRVSPAARGRRR